MILPLLIPLLLSVLTGFLMVSLFWPHPLRLDSIFLLRLCVAAGLGLGVSSLFFFLVWLPHPNASRYELLLIEAALPTLLGAALIHLKHSRHRGRKRDCDRWSEPGPLCLATRNLGGGGLNGAAGLGLQCCIRLL